MHKEGFDALEPDNIDGYQNKSDSRSPEFAIAEECFQYRECGKAAPFIDAGKPVLEVEYKVDRADFCPKTLALGFSSMKKRLSLGPWRRACKSAEPPEVPGESEPFQDGLILLERVWVPVGREAVAPPLLRELGELRNEDRPAWFAASEPALDVLLRPEEVHRASGEDDVIPPVRGGDEAVEEKAFVIGPVVADFDADLLAAVRTKRLNMAVGLEDDADPEGIPRAVRVPVAIRGVDPKRSRDGRERIRHPNRRAGKVEHESVRFVKPSPALLHLRSGGSDSLAGLLERGRATEPHEERVRCVAELDVSLLHG